MKHGIRHISISKPCTEDWNDMHPDAKGRFCSSCQKSVTDFSGMTNDEILTILSSSSNVCGRFGQLQLAGLNSELALPKPTFSWRKFGIAAAIAGLVPFLNAKAQTKTGTEQHIPSLKKRISANDGDLSKVIKGKVLDAASKKPVSGAEVRIKGNNEKVLTDAAGNFEVTATLNLDTTLVCNYMGHITQEINISRYQPFYTIEIAANTLPQYINPADFCALVGGVDIAGVEIKQNDDTFWLMLQIFR